MGQVRPSHIGDEEDKVVIRILTRVRAARGEAEEDVVI